MGTFVEIIINSQKATEISPKVNSTDAEIELQGWLILMARYRDNRPIPVSLELSLYEHFRFYWSENRLSAIMPNDNLERLPH